MIKYRCVFFPVFVPVPDAAPTIAPTPPTFYKYTLLRKSTCLEMEKKMTAIRNKVEAGKMMNYSEWCSINSYKGWLKYADTFRLYQKYVVPLLPYADDYYIRNIKPNTKKGLKAS